MKVELRPHPTIKGLYATEDGAFFQELSMSIGYGGYAYIHVKGTKFAVRRHTLMLEIWKGPRPSSKVGRHLNGNPNDDTLNNLEWGTQEENCQDTVRHGRSTKGEKNAQSKLTALQITEIKARALAGESGKALAADFGVSPSTICDIKKHRTWGE